MKLTDDQIKHMVNRFLGWKLPKTFNPDCGVKFDPVINAGTTYEHRYEPSGTNIFDYNQAEEMVKFMLDGIPAPTAKPERLDVEAIKREIKGKIYPSITRQIEITIDDVINYLVATNRINGV